MFGNDLNKFSKTKDDKKAVKEVIKDPDDLEEYLKSRNAVIGEETKTIAESKEEIALNAYLKLRSRTIGEDTQLNTYEDKNGSNPEDDSLESYLQLRNETLQDDISELKQDETELDAYIRQRKIILEDSDEND